MTSVKSRSWRGDFAWGILGLIIGVASGLLQPPQPELMGVAAMIWCVVACVIFPLAHYAPSAIVRLVVQVGFVGLASCSVVVVLR